MRFRRSPLVISVVALAACATPTGTDRSRAAQRSAESLRDDYQDLGLQVEATVRALDRVVTPPSDSNLRNAYSSFVSEFNELDSLLMRVRAGTADLERATTTYITAWENEMSQVKNVVIRDAATERRTEAQANFAEASAELERTGENFINLGNDLRDIKMGLDNDLTAAGVRSLSGVIADLKAQATTAVRGIPSVVEVLEGISTSLANTAPQPARR